MLNTECNGGRQSAGFIAQDGKLWFPTMGGVVVIDPEAAPANLLPPPVKIESVTLERGQVDFSQGITVAPGQRDLEIAYTGLSFIRSEQVKFKYRLEGMDTDWVDAGTRRVAYFPYLSPGSYTFRVLAANSDSVWNTVGADLSIVVEPPFWRRWWFTALASLSVAGTVLLIFRKRVARLRQAHAAQEAFSRQLLDSQEQERQRIAAELHDSLGQSLLIIKNRSFLALDSFDDPETARAQVEEISDASAHAIEEVREIAYNLRPYKMERFGLTKTLQAMCQQAERTSGIRFSVELKNIDSLFPNEAELNLYRVVQESVNNILKHSRATEARLTIERDESEVRMKIEDNGQGFNATPQASANEPRRGGFGLIGMAERVRLLGGQYMLDSAPGQGTTIAVKLMIPEE
jgi:signal transduction histidine kinase